MQVLQEAEAARNKSSKLIGHAVANGDQDELDRLKSEVSGAKNVISAMGIQVESEKVNSTYFFPSFLIFLLIMFLLVKMKMKTLSCIDI